jgi:hypothetical protein
VRLPVPVAAPVPKFTVTDCIAPAVIAAEAGLPTLQLTTGDTQDAVK